MTKPINKPIPYHHTEQFRAEASLRIYAAIIEQFYDHTNERWAVNKADELIAALDKKP